MEYFQNSYSKLCENKYLFNLSITLKVNCSFQKMEIPDQISKEVETSEYKINICPKLK